MSDFIAGALCGYLACGAFIIGRVMGSTWHKYGWRHGRAAFVFAVFFAVFLWPRLIHDEVQ